MRNILWTAAALLSMLFAVISSSSPGHTAFVPPLLTVVPLALAARATSGVGTTRTDGSGPLGRALGMGLVVLGAFVSMFTPLMLALTFIGAGVALMTYGPFANRVKLTVVGLGVTAVNTLVGEPMRNVVVNLFVPAIVLLGLALLGFMVFGPKGDRSAPEPQVLYAMQRAFEHDDWDAMGRIASQTYDHPNPEMRRLARLYQSDPSAFERTMREREDAGL